MGYPVPPALFVVMTAAMVVYLLRFRPIEALLGWVRRPWGYRSTSSLRVLPPT